MTTTPERRTAMYHSQLAMGAVMEDADGWQLPLHYVDADQEARWLHETVGVSDVSPIGKVRVVGNGAAQAVESLAQGAADQPIGAVIEGDSNLRRGGKLLSVRLAHDEYLLLTPAGESSSAVAAMSGGDYGSAYAVDVTSGLCAVAIVGPRTQGLLSRITDVNTSESALPDLSSVQSRFADVQGLLLRRDVDGTPIYQLYASREFGEYLWDTLAETARDLAGGPIGTHAFPQHA